MDFVSSGERECVPVRDSVKVVERELDTSLLSVTEYVAVGLSVVENVVLIVLELRLKVFQWE